MKKEVYIILFVLVQLCPFRTSATPPINLQLDTTILEKGEALFIQNCAACHNSKQAGIGPALGGLTAEVSETWIKEFIKNPKKLIDTGDKRALESFKKYKVVMPPFAHLTDDDITGIIAFLKTQKKNVVQNAGNELLNPIKTAIKPSKLSVALELVAQFPATSTKALPITRITKLGSPPNKDDLFVLELRGQLYKMQNNKPTIYMDMVKLKPNFIPDPGMGSGFGSFAFHPDFAKNGLLYTTHTEKAGSAKADFGFADTIKVTLQWVLTEWKTTHPEAETFSGTSRELFRINMPTSLHGVQEITFNPLAKPDNKDYGMLYIGIGDGGSAENGFSFLLQSTEMPWGSILRINPSGNNSNNKQYGIPEDNPFVKNATSKTVKELYAYGFRNPHRITWTKTNQMLAGNIGHANLESLYLIESGHNYGWPLREGAFEIRTKGDMSKVYALPANDKSLNITYPVAQYDHDEGKAICGGFEYWGKTLSELKGKYLFGDINNGRLFYINTKDIKQGKQASIKEWTVSINGTQKKLLELCGGDRVHLRFGRDNQGEVYILTKTDGKVYKLVPKK